MINREKLLEWLDVEIDLSQGTDPVLKADRWSFNHVKKAIESGRFNDAPSQGNLKLDLKGSLEAVRAAFAERGLQCNIDVWVHQHHNQDVTAEDMKAIFNDTLQETGLTDTTSEASDFLSAADYPHSLELYFNKQKQNL